MTSWRLANCLVVLISEVNAAHPKRPRESDGTIGDIAHQHETQSDHNPNSHDIVTAWDCTTADFTDALANTLQSLGRNGDKRVKYVIYKRHITSAEHGWQWAPYSGVDPHTSHIHLSVSADPAEYDRKDLWNIGPSITGSSDDMTPDQAAQLDRIDKALTRLMANRRTDHADANPNELTLADVLNEVDSKK